MKRNIITVLALAISTSAFAQEAIRFQIPTEAASAPAQNVPLNLPALTAKDTAGVQTYAKRLALVQDSISAAHKAIETAKTKILSLMPKLEPKGEFEKQAEFEARQSKWNADFAQMQERDTKSFTARLAELENAKAKIQENQAEVKSIFSAENELNFIKILSKDTTVDGYLNRIAAVKARKAEVENEIKQILADFPNTFPALEPQKAGETQEQFSKRHEDWTKEGVRQHAELQRKSDAYNIKLNRSEQVLNDYIIEAQSSIASVVSGAKVELGNYDSEKENFAFTAQDSASEKYPFVFSGKVGIPLNTAKTLNRNAPGFVTMLQFINYPFQTDSAKVNLAMSKFQLLMAGQELKVEGSFGEIQRYKQMQGYANWKLHADSLLSGSLKPQGLDYAYAMQENAEIKDLAVKESDSKSGGGLGWRGWTRIVTYTLAAGSAGFAIFKHLQAGKSKDNISTYENYVSLLDKTKDNTTIYKDVVKKHDDETKRLNDLENQRLIVGIGAGVFALAGTITFFF